jgi:hypothetical protein
MREETQRRSPEIGAEVELAKAALAHVIGDKVEQAYRRGDARDKRRKLMDAGLSMAAAHQRFARANCD